MSKAEPFFINVYQSKDGHQYVSGVRFIDREHACEQYERLLPVGLKPVFRVRITMKEAA